MTRISGGSAVPHICDTSLGGLSSCVPPCHEFRGSQQHQLCPPTSQAGAGAPQQPPHVSGVSGVSAPPVCPVSPAGGPRSTSRSRCPCVSLNVPGAWQPVPAACPPLALPPRRGPSLAVTLVPALAAVPPPVSRAARGTRGATAEQEPRTEPWTDTRTGGQGREGARRGQVTRGHAAGGCSRPAGDWIGAGFWFGWPQPL